MLASIGLYISNGPGNRSSEMKLYIVFLPLGNNGGLSTSRSSEMKLYVELFSAPFRLDSAVTGMLGSDLYVRSLDHDCCARELRSSQR